MTLTEFLEARIAEDEAAARQSKASDPHNDQVFDYDVNGWYDHDRVLAECAAKRRIVELAAAWEWAAEHPPNREVARGLLGTAQQLRSVVASLATVYADHPDFDEAWRP